jgi:hypothetical protein
MNVHASYSRQPERRDTLLILIGHSGGEIARMAARVAAGDTSAVLHISFRQERDRLADYCERLAAFDHDMGVGA